MGCLRILGELKKLGVDVSATIVKKILPAEGLGPTAKPRGPSWREFLRSQAESINAASDVQCASLCPILAVQVAWRVWFSKDPRTDLRRVAHICTPAREEYLR